MQYSLPQFVEVEDRIIGPLSLRQFLILLFGGLVVFMYWSIFGLSFWFFIFTLPTGGFFAFLAFGKFNGLPVMSNLPNVFKFFSSSRVRVFQRTGEKIIILTKKAPPQATQPSLTQEPVGSRFKRLAYLLDQKTAEEERLIHSGQLKEKWLNQI